MNTCCVHQKATRVAFLFGFRYNNFGDYMKEQKKLEMQMFLLFIIVFIFFGTITLTIKLGGFMTPKIDKKLNNYVEKNYKEIKNDITIENTKYIEKDSTYRKKIINKKNKDLYFYVNYKNKKIKSTYKKDYQEASTLFNKEKIKIEKEIKDKYKETKVTFPKKLNSYTKINQEKIITGNIKEIPIYVISTELAISNWNQQSLVKEINDYNRYLNNKNFNPKKYNLTISNTKNIDQIIKIKNLTTKLTETDFNLIIDGIIKKDKSIIKKYNIDYQYTN